MMISEDFYKNCFSIARYNRHDTVTIIDMMQAFLRMPGWNDGISIFCDGNRDQIKKDLSWLQSVGRPHDLPEPDFYHAITREIDGIYASEYRDFCIFRENTDHFSRDKNQFISDGASSTVESLRAPAWKSYTRVMIRAALCDQAVRSMDSLYDAGLDILHKQYNHPLTWISRINEAGFLVDSRNIWQFATSFDPDLEQILLARSALSPTQWSGAAGHLLPQPAVMGILLDGINLAEDIGHHEVNPEHLAAGLIKHPRIMQELTLLGVHSEQLGQFVERNLRKEPILVMPADVHNPLNRWPASLTAMPIFRDWSTLSASDIAVPLAPRIEQGMVSLLTDVYRQARHQNMTDMVQTRTIQALIDYQPHQSHGTEYMPVLLRVDSTNHTAQLKDTFIAAGLSEQMLREWENLSHMPVLKSSEPVVFAKAPQEAVLSKPVFRITDDAFGKAVTQFTQNLTSPDAPGIHDTTPVKLEGRDEEIEALIMAINGLDSDGAIITGAPGTGKSALTLYYANMIMQGKVPSRQRDITLLEVNVEALTAGANRVGDFEERFHTLFEGARERNLAGQDPIVFAIPEAHTIIGAGTYDGQPIGMEQRLKKLMQGGALKIIMDVDTENFERYFINDEAFLRRCNVIRINEPPPQIIRTIINNRVPVVEEYYGVNIPSQMPSQIYEYSKRFAAGRSNPDASLKILDRVANKASMAGEPVASEETLLGVVAKFANVPESYLDKSNRDLMRELETGLKQNILAQDEAIDLLVSYASISQVGLKDPRKPVGSFLFLGPTGVGKTETCRQVAKYMLGSEDKLLRINMSEYMEPSSVSKLIGTAPGYVGSELPGILTGHVRRNPNTVIVFDEIEKAHPDVLNLMLQILDDGKLQDGKGRVVDFRNCWVMATSNIGASQAIDDLTHPQMGFSFGIDKPPNTMALSMIAEAENYFRPEFMNRLNVVPFNMLPKEVLPQILQREMKTLNAALEREHGFSIILSQNAQNVLISEGFHPRYGARPLQRVMDRQLKAPLARLILTQDDDHVFRAGTYEIVDVGKNFSIKAPDTDLRVHPVTGYRQIAANNNISAPPPAQTAQRKKGM